MFERWFPESASLVAREIDRLFWYSTAWTGATGLIVVAILVTFIVRYRKKAGRSAFYTHGNSKGALFLTLSLAALVFILLDVNLAYKDHLVWDAMFGRPPSSEEALKVEVMAEQFAWNIRYAGVDAEFGTADDIVTMNEFRVPSGRPVILQMSSKDVIHSFFLPNLRIKQDVVPGMVTSLYFLPEQVGQYNIACAEHCGLGHYRMKGAFTIEPPADFDAWMSEQSKNVSEESGVNDSWAWDWKKGLIPGKGLALKKESQI